MDAAPFSVRIAGKGESIADDFPVRARNSLKHLLVDLIDKRYAEGWGSFLRELHIVLGIAPAEYDSNRTERLNAYKNQIFLEINSMSWEKIYDFCERIYWVVVRYYRLDLHDDEFIEDRHEPRKYIERELNRIFLSERLAYSYVEGVVVRFGRKNTEEAARKAQNVLGDSRLKKASIHFQKSLRFFRSHQSADYENAVKEAVCSLEAAGLGLFPHARVNNFSDLLRWLSSDKSGVDLPQTIHKVFTNIYAVRGSANGVAHGGTNGGEVTADIAEFMMAVCASQIVLLYSYASNEGGDTAF